MVLELNSMVNVGTIYNTCKVGIRKKEKTRLNFRHLFLYRHA